MCVFCFEKSLNVSLLENYKYKWDDIGSRGSSKFWVHLWFLNYFSYFEYDISNKYVFKFFKDTERSYIKRRKNQQEQQNIIAILNLNIPI